MIPKEAIDRIRERALSIETIAYKMRHALDHAPATPHEVLTICDRLDVDLQGIRREAEGKEIGS